MLLAAPLRAAAAAARARAAAVTPAAPALARGAGHSKWAKIARGKGANDVARGALFAKLSRGIGAAVRAGGADAASNLRLAALLDAARRAGCPRDVVDRALRTRDEGAALAETTFELTAAGGVALIVDCLTDNQRRTAPAVRHAAAKHGADVAAPGAAAWAFATRGRVAVALPPRAPAAARAAAEDALLAAALDAGAVDVDFGGGGDGGNGGDGDAADEAVVWCDREALAAVRGALGKAGAGAVLSAALARVPTSRVRLSAADGEAFAALLAALDALDDVQSVTHNAAEEEAEEEGGGG